MKNVFNIRVCNAGLPHVHITLVEADDETEIILPLSTFVEATADFMDDLHKALMEFAADRGKDTGGKDKGRIAVISEHLKALLKVITSAEAMAELKRATCITNSLH